MARLLCIVFSVLLLAHPAAAERSIRVFVALADNASQGIAPVPPKIGNGDNPDDNLYWGCTEGFNGVFRKSAQWRLVRSQTDVDSDVLRRLECVHASGQARLQADAYRGSAIKKCLQDFEACLASNTYDLVVYIGHNGLMDFNLELPAAPEKNKTRAVALCCKSEAYFKSRIEKLKAKPVLLTTQLMYPGAFILRAALEPWLKMEGLAEIRAAAGRAYAANQGISVRAAAGVFAKLEDGPEIQN